VWDCLCYHVAMYTGWCEAMTKTLFKTVIGSHCWGMNTSGSDTDYFTCYQVPTREILRGQTNILKSKMTITNDIDTQESELGLVVHQLIKNNLNYIVNTMSPIIVETSPEHEQLKSFFPALLSKQLYFSFHGMAVHNLKLFHKWWGDDIPPRKFGKIARVLKLGTRLLYGESLKFEAVPEASEPTVLGLIAGIDTAYAMSELPETCPQTQDMLDWLVEARLKYL
jgi:hypothetical protein